MQISDVIADMLTRIRNANDAKHETVDIPASNLKKSIAHIGTTSCQRGSKAYGLRDTIILAHNPNPDEFGVWRIFLCPNSSFSLSKLEFLAFQTEVSSL